MNDVIGIIGAGTIADSYYIPTLKRLGVGKVQVCDVNTSRALSLAGKHHITAPPLESLLKEAAVLIIATPPHTHYSLLKQCIASGCKTIICEKPFLYAEAEAQEILALASQAKTKLLVAHIRRCFTAIRLARKLIPTLQLGRLISVKIWEGGRFSYRSASGYTSSSVYGGVLLDTGSHALDAFLYVAGLTREKVVCKVNRVQKDRTEPAHEVVYDFHLNDVGVTLSLSRYTALANKISLSYENGSVDVPLGLYPNVVVTQEGQRKVYSSDHGCISYMSQAFSAELNAMLVQQDEATFRASDFLTLTSILETLYSA